MFNYIEKNKKSICIVKHFTIEIGEHETIDKKIIYCSDVYITSEPYVYRQRVFECNSHFFVEVKKLSEDFVNNF